MLSTLGSGLLLSCVATLGYCVKQLGSWMLGAIKAGVLYMLNAQVKASTIAVYQVY
jgi:hypothetical protein